ncbi:MAG: two-component regulator propeller domain-containing protein [Candidatus Latescibacter sp.]|nr:two-component regulator propeller domain-containing protein [Candidatus Latescibacter sp.]
MRLILRIIPIIFFLLPGTSHGDGVWKYFINGNNINDISVQGDALWCATTTLPVLWNIRDSTYTRYTDRNLISLNQTFVASDTRGNTWFGFSGLLYTYPLLKRFDGKNWTTFSNSTLGLEKKSINSMLCDRKGILWLGSNGGGILSYDGTSWGNMKPEESFNGTIQGLTVGKDGRIWISTDNGLYTFDRSTWKRYTTTDGLTDNNVRQALFDSEGNLWFATLGGVSCYDRKTWKSYHILDGLVSNSVNAVALDQNGRKWFATEGGVSCFDGNVWTSYRESDGLISDRVSGLAVDRDNRIWFCHKNADKGISCFDGKRIIWYTIWNTPLPSNHVEAVACDREGVIWLATDKGVARYDGNSWKLFRTTDGLAQNQVSEIYVDDQNTKWFVYNPTTPSGVTRYDGLTWKTYTTADGLRNNVIRAVAMNSDGSVWFGVREGITLYDGHILKTYPGNDQLLSSNILSITEGPDGVYWFATDRGLSKYDGQSWKTFSRDDGLSSESPNPAIIL